MKQGSRQRRGVQLGEIGVILRPKGKERCAANVARAHIEGFLDEKVGDDGHECGRRRRNLSLVEQHAKLLHVLDKLVVLQMRVRKTSHGAGCFCWPQTRQQKEKVKETKERNRQW
jgi:hypothetical protein